MRRYLVVAHQTLGGAALMEHLHDLRVADPYCRFHVVVPRLHPSGTSWHDGTVDAAARRLLAAELERLAEMGMGSTGEIGDTNPVQAVDDSIRYLGSPPIAGIIVSTLPPRESAWLQRNIPKRMAKRFPQIPVSHVVASDSMAAAN